MFIADWENYSFVGVVSRSPYEIRLGAAAKDCLGTLLADNLVLTSADCVVANPDGASNDVWVRQ
jgi:hypothetical protein